MLGQEMGYETSTCQMQSNAVDTKTDYRGFEMEYIIMLAKFAHLLIEPGLAV